MQIWSERFYSDHQRRPDRLAEEPSHDLTGVRREFLRVLRSIVSVADIVKARLHRRPVVVVSAMRKTTNSLMAIAQDAALRNRVEAMARLGALEEFHRREASALVAKKKNGELETILDLHLRNCEKSSNAYVQQDQCHLNPSMPLPATANIFPARL
jgi:hypothetical protein